MHTQYKKGFSLVELIIGVALTAVVALAVSSFARDVISFNRSTFSSLAVAQMGSSALRTMVTEIREATLSNAGGFPVSEASSSAITFFSDVNNDGLEEQVRYYRSSSTLYRSVVAPVGNPVSYATSGAGVITTLASNITNGTSTALFEYYDGNYSGTTTALSQPVNPQQIRLVKITLIVDSDPNKSPVPMTFTTQVSIRNLKDNL